MRRFLFLCVLCLAGALAQAEAATGRIYKVLQFYLDEKGRHAISPSLYDRDAYQAYLRQNPLKRTGILFKVHWKAKGDAQAHLTLRVEVRGTTKGDFPKLVLLEKPVRPGGLFGHWSALELTGQAYKELEDITAWRATLWEGETQLSQQQSFLW